MFYIIIKAYSKIKLIKYVPNPIHECGTVWGPNPIMEATEQILTYLPDGFDRKVIRSK